MCSDIFACNLSRRKLHQNLSPYNTKKAEIRQLTKEELIFQRVFDKWVT